MSTSTRSELKGTKTKCMLKCIRIFCVPLAACQPSPRSLASCSCTGIEQRRLFALLRLLHLIFYKFTECVGCRVRACDYANQGKQKSVTTWYHYNDMQQSLGSTHDSQTSSKEETTQLRGRLTRCLNTCHLLTAICYTDALLMPTQTANATVKPDRKEGPRQAAEDKTDRQSARTPKSLVCSSCGCSIRSRRRV